MEFKWAYGTDNPVYDDALKIRHEVFVNEQGWDKSDEVDGLDDVCHHLVGYDGDNPVVTTRLYPEVGDDNTYGIQRVATAAEARGSGHGSSIMDEIIRHAKDELGLKRLEMSAQDHAIPFYEKNGFKLSDEEGYDFLDIPHHTMYIDL